MFSLVRSAARALYLDCSDPQPLEKFLLRKDLARRLEREGQEDLSYEGDTILCLRCPQGQKRIHIVRGAPEYLLIALLNGRQIREIRRAHLAPGVILLRLVGRVNRVINRLAEEFEGLRMDPTFLPETTETPQTAIYFTSRSLNHRIMKSDLFPTGLLIPGDLSSNLPQIRERSIDLMNLALKGKKWTEAEIRIGDAAENYSLHYRRFSLAVRALQLGVIIQESWGRDYPMVMRSVPVYRIRMVTPFPLAEIKKVTIALEFSRKGPRLADMDVMEGREKMHWGSFMKSEALNERYQLIAKFQEELFRRLGPDEARTMETLEEEALNSR